MEQINNKDVGAVLLSLLLQQRYLYHQLKILAHQQYRAAGTNSPELLLDLVVGRRKLLEKLRDLDTKLRPIKTNWQKLAGHIEPQEKAQARKVANQVSQIVGEILAVVPSETAGGLPLGENCTLDELFVESHANLEDGA